MTEAEVFDRVILFLKDVNTNAKLINPAYPGLVDIQKAYEDKPRPLGAYAAVNLLSHVDLEEVDCNVFREIEIANEQRGVHGKVRAVEWLIRLEVYATFATDFIRLVQAALRSDYTVTLLHPLVVRRIYTATRSPIQVQQAWEGRANFDFRVAAPVLEETLTEFIESGDVGFEGQRVGAPVFETSISFQRN